MVALYQDPEGEHVLRDRETSQSSNLAIKVVTHTNHHQMQVLGHPDCERVKSLRRRVKELETKLSQYQV